MERLNISGFINTDVSHQMFELSCGDLTTSVFIQSSECEFDHLLILYWLFLIFTF